ncbi:sensor histidine kinase [Caldicellulosiruptoraceae bacterium PP1]
MKEYIHSIQFKLIIFLVFVIFSVVLMNILIQFNIEFIISSINQTVESIKKVNDIKLSINDLNYNVQHFLTTGDSDSFLKIYDSLNTISAQLNEVNSSVISAEEYMYVENIYNIFNNTNALTEKLIIYKKGNINFLNVYLDYSKTIDFINYYLAKLSDYKINHNLAIYKKIQKIITTIKGINNIIIFIWTLLATILAFIFAKQLTSPITRLARYSNKVAEGNLDIEMPEYKSNDEIAILYTSFNNMLLKVKDMLKTLEEKAELERIINEQKIEFIKYKQALQEAELKSLQSQINPHFLFNTLNTIIQIAMFENAEKTYDILLKTSSYLRYTVHNINKAVTLMDEIENIKNYMYIHSLRFGDNIELQININDECKKALVPSMILQPIIENSIIHGFSKKSKGIIKINVFKDDKLMHIEVSDNGVGMDTNTLEKLRIQEIVSTTSHGIGIENISKRIEYFYNIKNPLTIISEVDVGTTVLISIPIIYDYLKLPNRGEFKADVESFNS